MNFQSVTRATTGLLFLFALAGTGHLILLFFTVFTFALGLLRVADRDCDSLFQSASFMLQLAYVVAHDFL